MEVEAEEEPLLRREVDAARSAVRPFRPGQPDALFRRPLQAVRRRRAEYRGAKVVLADSRGRHARLEVHPVAAVGHRHDVRAECAERRVRRVDVDAHAGVGRPDLPVARRRTQDMACVVGSRDARREAQVVEPVAAAGEPNHVRGERAARGHCGVDVDGGRGVLDPDDAGVGLLVVHRRQRIEAISATQAVLLRKRSGLA